MKNPSSPIKGLAEASIRVRDLPSMQKFYQDVLGLEVLRKEEEYVFFKIAEGYGGHTQNLALFVAEERSFLENKSAQLNSETSTLHHIAFNIDLDDFVSQKERLEGMGLNVQAVDHEWIHLHSLYFSDPEGNTIEFLSFDDNL